MSNNLHDPFGRKITYLRLSLTDRCDLRCFYCMSENMVFLPKKELLTLEELATLTDAFIDRGVRKIRLTGGEPLVRKGFMTLVHHLSTHLEAGRIDEITLTTNATQLSKYAHQLKSAGVARINVSLDTLNPLKFTHITRGGNLAQVLSGIDAAQSAGLKVKINAVALKQDNADDIPKMIAWAHARDIDITLIEVMPMGDEINRFDQYIPLTAIRDALEKNWTLSESGHNTGGPARYVNIKETGGRLGFISPLSHNFCASCNRVRVTCTGKLFMCLGQNDQADLRDAIRSGSPRALDHILDDAISRKPEKHNFDIKESKTSGQMPRHMSVTGG
ncbi:MAG: GTP 3',8-cyclase MoaA [Robiginitomaculum sp.]|nr:MAG: GTP 3',8-cyclase MoaA [Robiginitomaculum sp.]